MSEQNPASGADKLWGGRFTEATRHRKGTARICAAIRTINEFLETLEQIAAEKQGSAGPRRCEFGADGERENACRFQCRSCLRARRSPKRLLGWGCR